MIPKKSLVGNPVGFSKQSGLVPYHKRLAVPPPSVFPLMSLGNSLLDREGTAGSHHAATAFWLHVALHPVICWLWEVKQHLPHMHTPNHIHSEGSVQFSGDPFLTMYIYHPFIARKNQHPRRPSRLPHMSQKKRTSVSPCLMRRSGS